MPTLALEAKMKAKPQKTHSEETGNIYMYKPGMGVDPEKRMRQLNGSYYGKKPAPDTESTGTFDSPMKTMRSP